MEFRTATVSKSLNPEWNENFTFPVTDVTDAIHVLVYDQDRFHDPLFLGRVAVPLLPLLGSDPRRIERVEELSLALKDKRLEKRAKGAHPQVRLRIEFCANKLRWD